MGIQLDWEVEAEGGWQEVGEDELAAQARRQRNRRLRNGLLALLAVAVLVGGGIILRLKQVRRQIEAELEATIAAETLALRIGDRTAFLGVQSEVGEWQRIQGKRFDDYQSLGTRVNTQGEIVELEVDSDRARVVLREQLDGQPYQVTWFYAREDGEWQHIPPVPDSWGELVEAASAYADFSYRQADQALVDALMPRLDDWWARACQVTGCAGDELPRPHLRIVPDPLVTVGWADYDRWTLLIPSPSLGRVPEQGSPLDAELSAAVADLVATRWAHTMLMDGRTNLSPASDLAWVEQELALWLRHDLDPTAPAPTFLTSLVGEFGPDLAPAFVQAIRRDDRLVPVLESLTGMPASELPVGWESYLAFRLQAETHLIAEGYTTEAGLLFRDLETLQYSGALADFPTEQQAVPESITIANIQPINDVLLAEVHFATGDAVSPVGEVIAYEPFRLIDSKWVHTRMPVEAYGASYQEWSEHFKLSYYELDTQAARDLLPVLEGAYAQLAEAFKVPADPAPSFALFITPYTADGFSTTEPPVTLQTYTVVMRVPSPYTVARPSGLSVQEYARANAIWELIRAIVASQAGPVLVDNPVAVAFMGWALAHFAVDEAALPVATQEMLEDSRTIQVLLDLLVETYGPQAIPLLLHNLPTASGIDEWLVRSLGVETSEAIRDQWQACLADAVSCPLDY